MATRRTTFSKTQRERDKRAKAAAKRERRASSEPTDTPTEATAQPDQDAMVAELARLQQRYDEGRIGLDDFVARREELRSRLNIT